MPRDLGALEWNDLRENLKIADLTVVAREPVIYHFTLCEVQEPEKKKERSEK